MNRTSFAASLGLECEIIVERPEFAVLAGKARRQLHGGAVHELDLGRELARPHALALLGHPFRHRNRSLAALLSHLGAPLRRRLDIDLEAVRLPVLGHHDAEHALRGFSRHEAVLDIIGDLGRVTLEHVAVAAATVVGMREHITRLMRRRDVGPLLDNVLAFERRFQLGAFGVGPDAVRDWLLLGDYLGDIRIADRAMLLAGGRRIAAAHAGVVVDPARMLRGHQAQMRRLVNEPRRQERAAAAISSGTSRVREDGAADVEHGHILLPDLDVAHVAFRIPTDIGRIEAVLDGERARACRRAFEVRHAERGAVLTLTAHLDHRRVDLTDESLLDEAAGDESAGQQPLEHTEGRQQKGPGCRCRHELVVGVRPGAGGKFQLRRHPGTIVDEALEVHVLRQRDEHAAVHAAGRAVHGVVAPGLRAVEVDHHAAVGRDLHLHRDVVEPVGGTERLKAGLALGDVAIEGVAAIDARNGELPGAGELAAAAFLDELLHHPLPVGQPHLGDDLLHALAHLDAGGDLGLLVQHPVNRHAQIALTADDIVTPDLVVAADFLGADEQAFGEPLLREADVTARRDATGLQLMTHRARPTDELTLVIDRDHIHDVGHLHGADEGVVVGEDVARVDARVLLVPVADHPFDEAAHGVNVHHDAVGERHRIAFRRVDGDHHLADLAHAWRGRDPPRHFARRYAERAQLRVQRLEFERVLLAKRQLRDAVVAAGFLSQPLGLEESITERKRADHVLHRSFPHACR